MIGQHDATAAHADMRGPLGQVSDQYGGGSAGDAIDAVVFGDPVTGEVEAFGQAGQRDALGEAVGGAAALPDGGQVQYGEGRVG
ncbi:hypothetical protein A8U91_03765 [Halomonas elongata]|uniref:Uncharacterized protein n=1 Tax=Halomonas elongata TaxID=2746 RepID=A0A1B8NXK8_HALEL|nr:hypothetical protein A8U91_03765 [Halomonas elongata]